MKKPRRYKYHLLIDVCFKKERPLSKLEREFIKDAAIAKIKHLAIDSTLIAKVVRG